MKKFSALLLLLAISMASCASPDEASPGGNSLELSIVLSILADDAQSMREITFSNMHVFRQSTVGNTWVQRDRDFRLIYVVPAEGNSPENPVYDINLTLIDHVYDGHNEMTSHVATDAPHRLLVPVTSKSDVIRYSLQGITVGERSARVISKKGKKTRLTLTLK